MGLKVNTARGKLINRTNQFTIQRQEEAFWTIGNTSELGAEFSQLSQQEIIIQVVFTNFSARILKYC